MSTPAISVIIAAYNAAATLPAQLEALADQKVAVDWEVVVCDNGSTDGTADLVRAASARMPWVRLVDASQRRGPGAARNVGARAAGGALLAFCDADDVVAEGWLAAMLDSLSRATLVTGRSRRPEFNSRPDDRRTFSWGIYRVPYFPYLAGAGAGNMGVHRDAFLDVGGFDEDLRTGEDLDLCWRMQLAGHELVEDPRAVVDVSNREGLSATIAQTFAYGAGDRRLKHKYALVEEAYIRRAGTAAAPLPEAGRESPPSVPLGSRRSRLPGAGVWGRAMRKIRSIRRPGDLTNLTRKAGTWLGFRFGRIDRSAPQVVPPDRLPPPGTS